jgi:hypothetical protein
MRIAFRRKINLAFKWIFEKVDRVAILMVLVIFIVPRILSFKAPFEFMGLANESNEIGDAIGGMTAPFINAISAILLYMAFQQQRAANNIMKEQRTLEYIQDQIFRLEDNFFSIKDTVKRIKIDIREYSNDISSWNDSVIRKREKNIVNPIEIKKIIYILNIFSTLIDSSILLTEANNDGSSNRKIVDNIKNLYIILYQEHLIEAKEILNSTSRLRRGSDSGMIELVIKKIAELDETIKAS